jgi:hypothetical protein
MSERRKSSWTAYSQGAFHPLSAVCDIVKVNSNRKRLDPIENAPSQSTFQSAEIGGSIGVSLYPTTKGMRTIKPEVKKHGLHVHRLYLMKAPATISPEAAPAAPPFYGSAGRGPCGTLHSPQVIAT